MQTSAKFRTEYSSGPMVFHYDGNYADGSPKISLWKNGEPQLTFTVCVEHHRPPGGYVWIKDYSENAGVRDELERENFIGPPAVAMQTSPFVTVTGHELCDGLQALTGWNKESTKQ